MRTAFLFLFAGVILGLEGCGRTVEGPLASIAALKEGAASHHVSGQTKIRGVVTFAGFQSDFLVIQDHSGGLRVALPKGHSFAGPGKWVEVSGRFSDSGSPDDFEEASTVTLRDGSLPEPAPLNLADPGLDRRLFRRVSLEGVVKSAILLRPRLVSLRLRSGNAGIEVRAILVGANDIQSFVNSLVCVEGVLLKTNTGTAARYQIWVPDIHHVRVVRAAVASPTRQLSQIPLRALRTALEVHQMSTSDAALRYPVRLTAVVTYFDPQANIFFVQDRTDAMYVQIRPGSTSALRAGDLVDIEGVTDPGEFAPSVARAKVTVRGRAPMPAPQEDIESAFLGQQDSRWLKLRGVVQSAVPYQSDVVATLVWGKHSFKAHIMAPLEEALSLIDREVVILGACGSVFNTSRQVLGIQLFVPSIAFVSPRSPAIADPFQLPLRKAGSLLQFSRNFDLAHRARIRGQVTLASRSGPTWIRDGDEGLQIESHDALDLREGDTIDAIGFPAAANFGPILQAATIRKLSSGPPVVPLRIDPADLSMGKADSQLIQLDGKFLHESVRDGTRTLRMLSGTEAFVASIPDSKPFPVLFPGARLRLTGICSAEAEDSQGALVARGFRLNLRSSDDVVVLESAPWFTMARLAATLSITLALIGAGLFWIFLLRRNVRSQTRLLSDKSSQLEAANVVVGEALARARESEALEQSRRCLMESIAHNEPLDAIMRRIAGFAEKHATDAVCALEIHLQDGARIVVPASSPPIQHCDSLDSDFLGEIRVPITVEGTESGALSMHATTAAGLSAQTRSVFPSWAQFATLAIERRDLYEKLSFRAQFDTLTGLHNRASLYERLHAELDAANRDGSLLAILYMDLNGFKAVNDTYGHDAGDRILQEAARRIRQSVRRSDLVARIGGDEFVVVLTQIPQKQESERIAALLRATLAQPMNVGASQIACGTSLGVGLFPFDGGDVETLLNYADQRMYAEKKSSRRCREEFDPSEVSLAR